VKNDIILTPFFLDSYSAGLSPLGKPDWRINEPILQPGTKQQRMISLYRPLASMVSDSLKQGRRPISIAGDCCTSIGVLAGLQQAGVAATLLWLDAHGDFNTWETTPSGFLGGMPLAMIVGRGEQTIVNGVGLKNLPEDQVVLSDARDLDPGERSMLESSAVLHVTDLSTLIESTLPEGPIYLHFDTDIINPEEAPAMSYAAPGGPSAEVIRQLFRRLRNNNNLRAISVSTWNPELDKDGRTRDLIMALISELI
jgi:arginase